MLLQAEVRKLTVLLARCYFLKFHFCTLFRGGFQSNRCQIFQSTKKQKKKNTHTHNPTNQRHISFWVFNLWTFLFYQKLRICCTMNHVFYPHLRLYHKHFLHTIFLQKIRHQEMYLKLFNYSLNIRNWSYLHFFLL